jgi:hypothetical protein
MAARISLVAKRLVEDAAQAKAPNPVSFDLVWFVKILSAEAQGAEMAVIQRPEQKKEGRNVRFA